MTEVRDDFSFIVYIYKCVCDRGHEEAHTNNDDETMQQERSR